VVSEGDCRAKAAANWTLAQKLANDGHHDWATTVAFYTALHEVNALLARAGKYTDDMDHPVRQYFLRRAHPAIETRYNTMFANSIRARYEVAFVADAASYERQVKLLDDVRDYVSRVMADLVPGV
jgi:hypothetical protein